jgi:hypothetical protein
MSSGTQPSQDRARPRGQDLLVGRVAAGLAQRRRLNVAARCLLQRAGRLLSLGLHRPHHVRRAVRRHLRTHGKRVAYMHGRRHGRRTADARRATAPPGNVGVAWASCLGQPSALINPQPLPVASPSAARSRPSSSTRALAAAPRTRCTHNTARRGQGTAAPARQSSASRRPHARRGTCHGSKALSCEAVRSIGWHVHWLCSSGRHPYGRQRV